jgi:sarcosine oxidase subunit alpha
MPTDALHVEVDGKTIAVPEGSTVAAAVFLSGSDRFRRSVTGEPRGPLCGMGVCFECRVSIDGNEHARSCQILCQEGMHIRTDE